MSDDKAKRGPADRSRINVNEPYELDYWTKELRVTPDALRNAVAKVGVMVADVRKYLSQT